jgi:twitching motility protein PilJ
MQFSFKSLDSTTWLTGFIIILVVSFIAMAGTFIQVARYAEQDEAYLEHVTQLRLLAQQISQHAADAANGKETSFGEVQTRQNKFKTHQAAIQNGDEATNTPPTPEYALETLTALNTAWTNTNTSIDALLQTKAAVTKLYERYGELTGITEEVSAQAETMLETLKQGQPDQQQMYAGTRLLMVLERIGNNIRRSFQGDAGALDAESQLGDDITLFGDSIEGLLHGTDEIKEPVNSPVSRQALQAVGELFAKKIENIDEFLDNSEQLFQAKEASNEIFKQNLTLLERIENLHNAYIQASEQRVVSPMLGYILFGVVLVMLLLLAVVIIQINKARVEETKHRLEDQMTANQRNQEAILRLLSEIADLADGDLTINATVTEDFTGAIADAINYSIEALRDLVVSINKTAIQVTGAAQRTRQVAIQLTEASERQAQQIAKAGQAIIGMANSVKKVSANAVESADVAKKSVEIASKGAKAVQDTIAGMDTIREQIQETSKRIKRLGESSQEIGEIVSLIDDISDQTNILALNASIQAAMAGESGRGFAVVADEVQRLAERASNATKQIDALVKTIQSDTNEAVSSMEQSTANVVAGAKLAESAGEALIEIESVSVKLAGQIENISQTSRTQAAVASNISGTMTIIQEITTQTSKGTNETAAAIERLAELTNELKTSVAGFKLPGEAQSSLQAMEEDS